MADTYFQTSIQLKNYAEFLQPILAETLQSVVELQDDTLIITSQAPLDEEGIKNTISAFLEEVDNTIEVKITSVEKENRDWIEEYKKGVKPTEAGEFYIHPSWHPEVQGKLNISVDPSLVFGTGEHPTTYLCIEAISEYLEKNQTLLDVGTGSGILALCGAKKGAEVSFCDTDEECVKSAKNSFEFNELSYKKSWIGSASMAKESYDFVVANIVTDILIFLKKDLTKTVKEGGFLLLSGILNIYRDKILSSYRDLTLIEEKQKGEWITFIFKKEENE